MFHRRQKYTRNHPWSLNSIEIPLFEAMKPEAKTRSFPPPVDPLSISRLFHQRALLKRATRVLYVCFSFPVEKSLIIGHGNAKWADQRDISLSSVYNTLAHSTNPFILPPPVENYLFYEDGRHISLDKKKRGKKKRRKKPRGLIKWRQQYSPSVSPGIFYHWGHRNSHNQRLLSRVNSELPPLASIFFRHIPLTVYPTLLHSLLFLPGVNSKKNSTQRCLKFRYVSCSRSLIFRHVSRVFTRRVLCRIEASVFVQHGCIVIFMRLDNGGSSERKEL